MLFSNNIGTKIQGRQQKQIFVMFDLKDRAGFMYKAAKAATFILLVKEIE